jgi:hypothetical protein
MQALFKNSKTDNLFAERVSHHLLFYHGRWIPSAKVSIMASS